MLVVQCFDFWCFSYLNEILTVATATAIAIAIATAQLCIYTDDWQFTKLYPAMSHAMMVLLRLLAINALKPLIYMPFGSPKSAWVVCLQAPSRGPGSMGQLSTVPPNMLPVANMYPECIAISIGFSMGKRDSQPDSSFWLTMQWTASIAMDKARISVLFFLTQLENVRVRYEEIPTMSKSNVCGASTSKLFVQDPYVIVLSARQHHCMTVLVELGLARYTVHASRSTMTCSGGGGTLAVVGPTTGPANSVTTPIAGILSKRVLHTGDPGV